MCWNAWWREYGKEGMHARVFLLLVFWFSFDRGRFLCWFLGICNAGLKTGESSYWETVFCEFLFAFISDATAIVITMMMMMTSVSRVKLSLFHVREFQTGRL